jgi:hypothetical protein
LSALTEKNKREIERQYKEWKRKREKKVLLSIYFSLQNANDGPDISFRIVKSVYGLGNIESAGYTPGTNVVTVIANWEALELGKNIEQIKRISEVSDVEVKILTPLF